MESTDCPLLDRCNKQFGFNKLRMSENNPVKQGNCAYKSGGK